MNESELLRRKQCEEILLATQAAAHRYGIADVEIHLQASSEALTRFANNAIGQNVAERSTTLSVRVLENGRTARASTNRLHRNGIESAVDHAVALTRASAPITDLLPLFEDPTPADGSRWSEAAAACTPAQRAAGVAEAIRVIQSRGQMAAGIYATAENVEALLNSRGLSRYYFDTLTTFSVTSMTADSSGWAKATSAVHEEVQPAELARSAAQKAALSADPQEIEAGEYTVVLEPAAVLDLVGQIFGDFSGTALSDQRSFLNERLGQRIFGENITIYDDVRSPLQTGAPFDGEGVPRSALMLVEDGVPKQVAHSRGSALRTGAEPTGHGFPLPNEQGEMPVNIVMSGGTASLQDLIQSTAQGILVTRLWYIREVEPFNKVMTGMTRDGTFLIRDGVPVRGLRNFRFNQSVVDLLCNVEALSDSVRASGEEAFDMVVPAIKAHRFRFTEVTRF